MSEAKEYLIKKGSYFYRPNSQGYTSFKFDAGRYSKADAEREAAIEPWHMQAIHQDDVPEETAPDKEFAKMKHALANWRDEVGKLHSQVDRKDAQIAVLTERLQAIIDWCDFAMKNADEFNSHGVRNLDGPVFDAARAVLAATEQPRNPRLQTRDGKNARSDNFSRRIDGSQETSRNQRRSREEPFGPDSSA